MAENMGPTANQAVWKDANNGQVIAEFYRDSAYMPYQSDQEKRPVFRPRDMVKISQAGEPDNLKEEVNEIHKQRFPQQWSQYQAGQAQMVSGVPLIELFPGNPEVIAQLKTVNVHTVEGLIAVADSAAHNVPFLVEWKNRARAYIERTTNASSLYDLEKRLDAEKAEKQALMDRLAALEEKFTAPGSEPKSKKAA